jgi:hypothetical protein
MEATAGTPWTYQNYPRSREVTREFQHLNPYPSKGKTYGAYLDWIEDLCKGGADAVWNMQWQTTAEAHAKDQWECR